MAIQFRITGMVNGENETIYCDGLADSAYVIATRFKTSPMLHVSQLRNEVWHNLAMRTVRRVIMPHYTTHTVL